MLMFIGWSKSKSYRIAQILRNWLPKVIQSVNTFVSTDDIEIGTSWNQVLMDKLGQADFGILCITEDNLNSPWLCYEAGALSLSTKSSDGQPRVAPILFGVEHANQVAGPLSHFQSVNLGLSTEFGKDAMWRLIQSVNEVCRNLGEISLTETNLLEVFDVFYPLLERQIIDALQESNTVFQSLLPNHAILENNQVIDLDVGVCSTIVDVDCMKRHLTEIPMGIYDNPQVKQQSVFYLNILRHNTAVFGSTMSGKTTFVKTLLLALNERMPFGHDGEEIYIIDCGGNLGEYSELSQVCAYFNSYSDSEEDINRIFMWIRERLKQNQLALKNQNFMKLLETQPDQCPPHMTLIFDNINSFLSDKRYGLYQGQILEFCRDGLSKGLTVLFTASETFGITRLVNYFRQRVAFDLPSGIYAEIFGQKISLKNQNPGRGLCIVGSSLKEFQCFLPCKGSEKSYLLNRIVSEKTTLARKILMPFPRILTMSDCIENGIRFPEDSGNICVGLNYTTRVPVYVKIGESRCIAIYGKKAFGKTNALRILLDGILRIHPDAHFILLDGHSKDLSDVCIPELYLAHSNMTYIDDLRSFWNYLCDNGYWDAQNKPASSNHSLFSISTETEVVSISANQAQGESIDSKPLTVFVLQNRNLFSASKDANVLMLRWFPMAIGNAEKMNYMFIFSAVLPTIDPETNFILNNNISTAFLLDDIGKFVAGKGRRSVFADLEQRNIYKTFAECTIGDGYVYDVDKEDIAKVKFIMR